METDARIQDLPEAVDIYDNDHFVVEQRGQAMKIDGRTFRKRLKGEQGDTGLTGPEGKPGMNAVISDLPDGMFSMEINHAGELVVETGPNTPMPPLSINESGELIYKTGG